MSKLEFDLNCESNFLPKILSQDFIFFDEKIIHLLVLLHLNGLDFKVPD